MLEIEDWTCPTCKNILSIISDKDGTRQVCCECEWNASLVKGSFAVPREVQKRRDDVAAYQDHLNNQCFTVFLFLCFLIAVLIAAEAFPAILRPGPAAGLETQFSDKPN